MTASCKTTVYRRSDILDEFCKTYFRFPKNLDEFLPYYEAGVKDMLLTEYNDTAVYKLLCEDVNQFRHHGDRASIRHFLDFKYLSDNKDNLKCRVTKHYFVAKNTRTGEKDKYLKWDIQEKVDDPFVLPYYKSVRWVTRFFDATGNVVHIEDEEMSDWCDNIGNASFEKGRKNKVVIYEYYKQDLHQFKKGYKHIKIDDSKLSAIYEIIQSLIKNHPQIERIVFPVYYIE